MQDEIIEQSPAAGHSRERHDPYSALRVRDYRLFLIGGLVANVGMQMQTAAVGWEIYERTRSAWALGWVGLAQIIPVIALILPAGHAADRLDRRRIIMAAELIIALASGGLAWISLQQASYVWIYVMLFIIGACRAFLQPARASMMPLIVPRERFSNAVTWSSGTFQFAVIVGPALGGWLIAILKGATFVYVFNAAAALSFFALLTGIGYRTIVRVPEPVSWRSLGAGFGFLRRSPVVFAAITLDMFAVLLGGADMLLPIYAHILEVGPTGYGWLRAAPGLGALAMSILLAYRPPMERSGQILLWSVAGFGLATIVFGFSRSYWLSLLMLFATGVLDMISVIIRHTLVQLLTPDAMRGRVSAINSLFIGTSNELGAFESGAVAGLTSPTFSVVSGGIGTLIVVAIVARAYPQLRHYDRLGSNPA
jgi:MFS family permease